MHCAPKQQHRLAVHMVEYFGKALLTYDEMVATGRATSLSPLDLQDRVLAKGKVRNAATTPKISSRSLMWKALKRQNVNRADAHEKVCSTETTQPRFELQPSSTDEPLSEVKRGESQVTPEFGASDSVGAHTVDMHEMDTPNVSKGGKMRYRSKSMQALVPNSGSNVKVTDEHFASCLALRSLPVSTLLSVNPPNWALPITSINEDRALAALGLNRAERCQIEGLHLGSSTLGGDYLGATEEQISSRAIARLAADPPPQVGVIQRRVARWLLRPYPAGLRFSGKNMNPLPFWLAGAQSVALNMSNVDLPLQLHFALFKNVVGYVLKPLGMRVVPPEGEMEPDEADHDEYWPPPRDALHRTTISIISLHNLPKHGEQRPRYDGTRAACHRYAPELSGSPLPPDGLDTSRPALTYSLHPIGGFCAISEEPLPQTVQTEFSTRALASDGMNVSIDSTVHCIAAEPHSTFVRIGVSDRGEEVAFEVAVLGRLRCGYRVLLMRGAWHGTRIELCYIFIHVTVGSEPNLWPTHRQQRRSFRARESMAPFRV
mmetsp:Transcript_15402/g.46245  ORF Transcript_15402/g.46245 Transcript_15402/m.46245 type:complete len:545 (-) Transcript_15402:93-1727(-)